MCTIAPVSLIGLIEHLTTKLPQLQLDLRETSGRSLLNMLLDGEIDVALMGLPRYPDSVAFHPLFEERYAVAFAPGHRFEAQETVSVADLRGERYLKRLNCEYLDHFEDVAGQWAVPLDVRYRSEHESWVLSMAVAGLGLAIVPSRLADVPGLVSRPLVEPTIRRTIGLATVRGRRHLPVVEKFVAMCRAITWPNDA